LRKLNSKLRGDTNEKRKKNGLGIPKIASFLGQKNDKEKGLGPSKKAPQKDSHNHLWEKQNTAT